MILRLDSVMSMGYMFGCDQAPSITVVMEYQPNCSKNRYKTRDGFIRRDVRKWMGELATALSMQMNAVGGLRMKPPVKVKIEGEFRDKRMPDLQNFVDIVADAVQEGIGIDDRYFSVETGQPHVGKKPCIVVTVEQGDIDA